MGAGSSIFTPSSSALSMRQPRSIISGRRWITTVRKLPMHRPSAASTSGDSKTSRVRASIDNIGSDDLAELEDRQVHRDHDAADQCAQNHDDERLHQTRQTLHRLIDLVFIEL